MSAAWATRLSSHGESGGFSKGSPTSSGSRSRTKGSNAVHRRGWRAPALTAASMRLLFTRVRNSGAPAQAMSALPPLVYAVRSECTGSSQGSSVGSSQGSFVGSRFHTTPPCGSEDAGQAPIEGSWVQADLIGRGVIDRGEQGW
jgi:hypothetical protein